MKGVLLIKSNSILCVHALKNDSFQQKKVLFEYQMKKFQKKEIIGTSINNNRNYLDKFDIVFKTE